MEKIPYLSLNVPATDKLRVVVIGGGFGGMNTIRQLRNRRFQIVLFDKHNYHTFQPLLYQVATAGLHPDAIAGPLRYIFRKQKDFEFRMLKVTAIRPDLNTISTPAGDLLYDYLVIAGGARPNFFGNKDVEKYALPMKSIPDALNLRSQLMQHLEQANMTLDPVQRKALLSFVLVGGGPTGVETAGALAELKKYVLPKDYPNLDLNEMKIYLVEGLDRLLPSMSEQASARAKRDLERLGVDIRLKTMVENYDGYTLTFKHPASAGIHSAASVDTQSAASIDTHSAASIDTHNAASVDTHSPASIDTYSVIWSAGVTSEIFPGLKPEWLEKGRVLTDENCRIIGSPNIFAIGDIALMKTKDYPKGHPGLAQVAIQMGKYVGRNLPSFHKPFTYFDKGSLATIGRGKAVADLPKHLYLGGRPAWWIWLFVHINYLVSFRNKLLVFASWIWNYFTYDKGNRLIIRPFVRKDEPVSYEQALSNVPDEAEMVH